MSQRNKLFTVIPAVVAASMCPSAHAFSWRLNIGFPMPAVRIVEPMYYPTKPGLGFGFGKSYHGHHHGNDWSAGFAVNIPLAQPHIEHHHIPAVRNIDNLERPRTSATAISRSIDAIEHDFDDVVCIMHRVDCAHIRELGRRLRSTSNHWMSFITAYNDSYRIHGDELADIRDALDDSVYHLHRIQHCGAHIRHYDYEQLCEIIADLNALTSPYQRPCARALHRVALLLDDMQHILADV